MWGKLKELMIEQEPGDATKGAAAPTASPAASTGAPAARQAAPVFTAPGVNQDFVAAIKKAIFARSTAFTTLLEASAKLEQYIPDPIQRMKAAWGTSGGGRSPQEVVNAATAHLADIDNEERRFNAAVQGQLQTAVGAQEQRAAALRTSNETARKQIESLTAQIQQLNETIIRQDSEAHQIDSEVTVARADLDSKAREFAAAAQFVRDELTAQRASITTTL